jgi:hypothetical protein
MMLVRRTVAVALVVLMATRAACAQSSSTGATFTVIRTADGFHFDTGTTTYDLTVNGEDHDIAPNHSVSLQPAGPGVWLRIDRFDGKEVSRTTYTLSDGGIVLTIATSGTRENGDAFRTNETALRKGRGNGLAGVWKPDEHPAAGSK